MEEQRMHGMMKNDVTLNNKLLLDGKSVPFSLGFCIFPTQLDVRVLALGLVVTGGALLSIKHYQRAPTKVFNSLLSSASSRLDKIHHSVLPRSNLKVGLDGKQISRLDLLNADKPIALVGDCRSGKTIFLANTLLSDLNPWWFNLVCPPRGLFLSGLRTAPTMDAWLREEIGPTEKDDPFAALTDLLSERRKEQGVRLFLHKLLKDDTPRLLKPQPVIIVVDNVEDLLCGHRGDFLRAFEMFVRKAKDTDLCRLVFVVNSENAVKALKLMYGGNLFTFIQAPKVTRQAVVKSYGEDVAKVFDDCDSNIGIAMDYLDDVRMNSVGVTDMTAEDYAAWRSALYVEDDCLAKEIAKEEYIATGEHFSRK